MRWPLSRLGALSLGLALLCSAPAAAQPADSLRGFLPTLSVGGQVRMRSLHVREPGTVRVRLWGVDTLRVVEREGLPERTQAGARYENVRVRFHYAVSPAVADALRGALALPAPTDSTSSGRPPDD
ncbi:MAG TPA: hypothetical protein VD962_03010 [Rubricoccaceae bacterium]|nr:hypothetical protein [Rubricoccaceae bacterium]